MNSEKVKEIKKALECNADYKNYNRLSYIDEYKCKTVGFFDILTLINELESENERLLNEKWDKEDDLDNYHIENQQLKDRIAELEKVYDRQVRIINDLNIEVVKQQKKLPKFAERLKEKVHKIDYVQGYAEIGLCEEIDETLKEFTGSTKETGG